MMFQLVSPQLLEGTITFNAFKMAAWRDAPVVARHYEIMQKYSGPSPTNFMLFAQMVAGLMELQVGLHDPGGSLIRA